MVALRKSIEDTFTVAQFLEWESGDQSGRSWQLVEGVPEAMAPATESHGVILAELSRLIGNHLVEAGRVCRVIVEPGIVPRVRSASNVRIPDMAVVCRPPSRNHLVLDPVLIVEILSPSNANETYANIWTYTTIPGLQEILIVSTAELKAEILRRQPDGNWPRTPEQVTAGAVLSLESVGMRLPLQMLYQGSGILPD